MIKSIIVFISIYWIPLSVLALLLGFEKLIEEKVLAQTLSWLVFIIYLLTPLFYISITRNPVEAVINNFVTIGLFVLTFALTIEEKNE